MKYRFFTIPVQGFEQAQKDLNRFVAATRVASVEKQFVADGLLSFWAVCVTCLDGPGAAGDGAKRGRVDYREVLEERDFAVFAKLRALRKVLADQEGVPPYALFTNDQLAAMAQRRVATPAALAGIEGVGKARMDKYGEKFLAALREAEAEVGRNEAPEKGHAADPD